MKQKTKRPLLKRITFETDEDLKRKVARKVKDTGTSIKFICNNFLRDWVTK